MSGLFPSEPQISPGEGIWDRFYFCSPFLEDICPKGEFTVALFPRTCCFQLASCNNLIIILLASYNNHTHSGLLSWFPHPQISVASRNKDLFLHHVTPQLYIANSSLPYIFFILEASLKEQPLWGTWRFPLAGGKHKLLCLAVSLRASSWVWYLSLLLKSICQGKPYGHAGHRRGR